MLAMLRHRRLTQEGIVFALAVVLFATFSLTLGNFLTPGNLIALVRSVSILGILGLGMGLVVISRGIDLAMVATMVVAVLLGAGADHAFRHVPLGWAVAMGAAFVVVVGLVSGILVAYAARAGHFHHARRRPGGLRRRPGVAVPGGRAEHAGTTRASSSSLATRHRARRTDADRHLRDPCPAGLGGAAMDPRRPVSSTQAATIRPPRASPAFRCAR